MNLDQFRGIYMLKNKLIIMFILIISLFTLASCGDQNADYTIQVISSFTTEKSSSCSLIPKIEVVTSVAELVELNIEDEKYDAKYFADFILIRITNIESSSLGELDLYEILYFQEEISILFKQDSLNTAVSCGTSFIQLDKDYLSYFDKNVFVDVIKTDRVFENSSTKNQVEIYTLDNDSCIVIYTKDSITYLSRGTWTFDGEHIIYDNLNFIDLSIENTTIILHDGFIEFNNENFE